MCFLYAILFYYIALYNLVVVIYIIVCPLSLSFFLFSAYLYYLNMIRNDISSLKTALRNKYTILLIENLTVIERSRLGEHPSVQFGTLGQCQQVHFRKVEVFLHSLMYMYSLIIRTNLITYIKTFMF